MKLHLKLRPLTREGIYRLQTLPCPTAHREIPQAFAIDILKAEWRLMAKFSEHWTPEFETGKRDGLKKWQNIGNLKWPWKGQNKTLREVIPPRICVTFRRATFRSRPKRSKSRIWDDQVENVTNTGLKRHDNFSGNLKNHEHRSKLDPYSTNRTENQAIWISKVLRAQWDHWGPPKLPYKIQNRLQIHWTPPTRLSTKFGHQP